MTKFNALVTAIGSFSALETITSLRKIREFEKIIGCDIYPCEWHNITKYFDNVLLAPKVKDEQKYLEFIIDLCEQFKIDIIIPLTDIEVDIFNKHRAIFYNRNIIVTIGNPNFLSVARNKSNLNNYSEKIEGISPIPSYLQHDLSEKSIYPLIAKPISGRSSEGIYILNSIADIKEESNKDTYIFQEIIDGRICTVDYVRSSKFDNDFCIPRWEHLRTKNGAGMTVEIFQSQSIERIASAIGRDLDINGCVNMEFIVNDNGIYLIDLNPRFSAGIGFSKLTGYNFIESHINCFIDKDILPRIEYKNFIAEKVMSEVINIQL